MSTDSAALRRVPAGRVERARRNSATIRRHLAGVAEREATLVVLAAAYAVTLLFVAPQMLVQDSWLSLVAGREIVVDGLPHTDGLALWTSGTEWVDQQWLAHVAFYGLFALGGIELALLAHVGLLVAAFVSGIVAARRLGGSTRSVCLVGLLCMFAAPWALQLRAQTFAVPLFVWLLSLLAADSRAPSRRVFLVFPLLVLWANLHGTVVLAALLVAARGVTYGFAELRAPFRSPRWAGRTALLTLAPFACLFASPYGLALAGYYRTMLVSPLLRTFVDEWAVSLPSLATMQFYVLGIAAAILLVRYRSRVTPYEGLALLALLLLGASAIRSIAWFTLAGLLLLPRLLDGALSHWPKRVGRRARLAVASAALASALVTVAVVATRPEARFTRAWPLAATERVADLVASRPGSRVFADARYSDWLLWEQPQLTGRIAYDIRFELLSRRQFEQIAAFQARAGADWRDAIDGYDIVVLDGTSAVPALRGEGRFDVELFDEGIAILSTRTDRAG